MGIRCPLSEWEEALREMAGQSTAAGETFMGRVLHNLLFVDQYFTNGRPPEGFFTTAYIAVFLIVAQAFLLYPPRALPASGGCQPPEFAPAVNGCCNFDDSRGALGGLAPPRSPEFTSR